MQISANLLIIERQKQIFASMSMRAEQIVELFNAKNPGVAAHDTVMSYHRPSVEEVIASDEVDPRWSAVVFLIYPKSTGYHFLLLKRHDYKGVHSGQVGLPGGRLEPGETKQEAMIRELWEETGLRIEPDKILTELTPLYIPPSNFIVYPYAAMVDTEPQWTFDDREVKRGIETPLVELMNEDILGQSTVEVSGGKARIQVKSFPFGGEVVWGATAMILSECMQILSKFDP